MAQYVQVKKALPIAIWLAWAFAEVPLQMVGTNRHAQLDQWALDNLEVPVDLGKLKYYKCPKDHWHASLAKNTAHMAACREVGGGLTPSAEGDALLVNLDGDNVFTLKGWSSC